MTWTADYIRNPACWLAKQCFMTVSALRFGLHSEEKARLEPMSTQLGETLRLDYRHSESSARSVASWHGFACASNASGRLSVHKIRLSQRTDFGSNSRFVHGLMSTWSIALLCRQNFPTVRGLNGSRVVRIQFGKRRQLSRRKGVCRLQDDPSDIFRARGRRQRTRESVIAKIRG